MSYQQIKTADAAVDKWHGLLLHFGVDAEYLTGKHCACPISGNGKDKFRFDDKEGRGTFICSECGAGDGFKFLKLLFGWDFKTAAKNVDKALDLVKPSKVVKLYDPEKQRKKLNKLKERFMVLTLNDPVATYLRNRGIADSIIERISDQLGWIPNYDYCEDKRRQGKYDAMAAMVRNNDIPVTYHITYLHDGRKARVEDPRKLLTPVSTTTGGAVQLFEHACTLGVAEGIETALSATQLHNIPTWAALNVNNLKSFVVPNDVTELHIFADNDSSLVGQEAAAVLAKRAASEGRSVKVHTPPIVGTDWNDILIKDQLKQSVEK